MRDKLVQFNLISNTILHPCFQGGTIFIILFYHIYLNSVLSSLQIPTINYLKSIYIVCNIAIRNWL